jgi:glyoxylase-like metal-dependent hydrolase (beta-lactamase superfamily II)
MANSEPSGQHGVAVPESALVYPFESSPAPGEAVTIAAGVYWLQMPLSPPLNHINVWLMDDGDGWTVVDTGVQSEDTAAAWRKAFAGCMRELPVTRVICTHMHPDHIGMSGWLTQRFGCRLWTTRLEYMNCRLLVSDTGRKPPTDAIRFYRRAGWDRDAIEHYEMRFGEFGKHVYPLPDSYRRVVDGEELSIGRRAWRAVVGRGHSPEHLCLHCPELGLMISGDQVLPTISSNVSVFATEPEADPLGEWLESMTQIERRVGSETLVLPAHRNPFLGLHRRLQQLRSGHERSLQNLQTFLAQPRRAIDTFPVLFRRPIDRRTMGIATGESLAHLNWLMTRGHARRESDECGVDWYSAT